MDEKEIKFIQDQIGYTFKNQELLVQAFTRRSYSMENGGQDNEVLEFIGDKALDFVVVKQLSEEFGHYSKKYQNWEKWGKTEETGTFISDLDEGELTEIKKQLVQKNTLADAIDNLGIAYYLIMGKGNIQDSLSVKEDLFEAILGAIALDSNWDIEALQDSMNVMLNPGELMFDEDVNYVAEIQAWSSANSGNIPLHCFYPTSMQGTWYMPRHHMCIYGKAEQDTHFACEVQIPGIDYHFVGYGRSKNLARMEAMIYSMTPAERSNPDLLNPSRKHRIAKGAGVDISEVNRMVKQFGEMRKLMKMVGKSGKKGRFRLPF